MLANARAVKSKSERVETEVDGLPWIQNAFPYQAKCVGWLRDEFRSLSSSDSKAASDILESAGCAALIGDSL